MADDPRRMDDLVQTVKSLRAQLDSVQNTLLNRMATHTHSGGGGGTVTSVTAGDATITIGGTGAAPTVAVNAIPESKVTNLTTDLAAKVPSTRQVASGTGLLGGGDLSADRSLSVAYGGIAGTAAQGNDSRIIQGAVGAYPLSAYGLIAASIHPDSINSTTGNSVSINTIEVYRVWVPANSVITGATCYLGTAGATPGAANASGYALYSDDGATQHRITTNDYTLFTTAGWRPKAWSAGNFTSAATDTWYRVAMIHTCTTPPKFATGIGAGSGFLDGHVTGATHRRGVFATSTLTFPASFTGASFGTLDNPMLFLGLY
jgi:hypothetical protein